jgi:hypothetical protein
MKPTKNNIIYQKIVVGLLMLVALAALVIMVNYFFSNYRDNKKTADTPQNSEEIIRSLLTPEEFNSKPEITIINSSNNYIKANLFFNPGGHYILAARVNGEWQKALEGNGIPKCFVVDKYNFPPDMVPGCLNDGGDIVNRK